DRHTVHLPVMARKRPEHLAVRGLDECLPIGIARCEPGTIPEPPDGVDLPALARDVPEFRTRRRVQHPEGYPGPGAPWTQHAGPVGGERDARTRIMRPIARALVRYGVKQLGGSDIVDQYAARGTDRQPAGVRRERHTSLHQGSGGGAVDTKK